MGNSANKPPKFKPNDAKAKKTKSSPTKRTKSKPSKKRGGLFRRSKRKVSIGVGNVKVDTKIPAHHIYHLVTPEKEVDPDEVALARIRKSLRTDLETFLLNNILMSVQFFENYEREVGILRVSPVSDSEVDRNIQLSKYQKHCVTPDKLHEVVSKRVQFRPQHGSKKHCTEYIHSPRLLVVQDNVELYEGTDSVDYSSVAVGPMYRLTMEAANTQGYVKLRYDDKRRPTYETLVEQRKSEEEPSYSSIPGEIPTPRESDEKVVFAEVVVHELPTLTEGQKMMLDLHEHIEGGRKDLSQSLNALNVDTKAKNGPLETMYGYSNSAQFKRKFGPQNTSSELSRLPATETPTERRLSGIIKSTKPLTKFTAPLSIAKLNRQNQLSAAKSLPNLTEGSATNPSAPSTRGSPQSDSSGYKSGSSSSHTNLSLPNSRGSEVDYGYATIKSYSTPKPLEQLRLGNVPLSASKIPEECFISVDVPLINKDSGKRKNEHGVYVMPDKLFETRNYLKSTSFAASFADVFSESLAEFLGLSNETIDSATMQGSQIYYDTLKEGPNLTPLKIHNCVIPTITTSSWPKAAYEWTIRQRKCVTDEVKHVAYTWPTQRMVTKIKGFGCHVLPEGFMPTRGENPEHTMEWGLAFPEAERYLESCLSHSQARCFMFTLAMYKNFMEPVNFELGLSTGNIRSILLWQCEKNYLAWPEDRPGETLRKFLSVLYEALMKETLPDYFVRSRNQLAGIPRTHIRRVQEKLCRVRENLIMHVMTMARNLRYVDEDNFFPRLDYHKLYSIVTTENIVALVRPGLARSISQQKVEDSDPEEDSDDGLWAEVRKADPQRQWIKKVNRQIVAEKAAQTLTNEFTRKSVESLDLQILPGQQPESVRREMLLELLIPHFIAMAKRSHEFRATRQSSMYLLHAERLSKLLGEETNNSSKVRKFMAQIKVLREAGILGIDELNSRQPVQTYTSKKSTFLPPESPTAKITMELPPIPNGNTIQTKATVERAPPPAKRAVAFKRIEFVFPDEDDVQDSVDAPITNNTSIGSKTPDSSNNRSLVSIDDAVVEESTDF